MNSIHLFQIHYFRFWFQKLLLVAIYFVLAILLVNLSSTHFFNFMNSVAQESFGTLSTDRETIHFAYKPACQSKEKDIKSLEINHQETVCHSLHDYIDSKQEVFLLEDVSDLRRRDLLVSWINIFVWFSACKCSVMEIYQN